METPYSSKGLAGLLAQARSDINSGNFERAREMADYLETLSYEMTSWGIRKEIRKAQKRFGTGFS